MNNAFAERPLKPLEYVTMLDQDTRLELALTAWKAVVLATDTNPGGKNLLPTGRVFGVYPVFLRVRLSPPSTFL